MKSKSHRILVVLARPAPRNPFAAAARQRLAGRHGKSGAGQRQAAGRALRAELTRMRHPTP